MAYAISDHKIYVIDMVYTPYALYPYEICISVVWHTGIIGMVYSSVRNRYLIPVVQIRYTAN